MKRQELIDRLSAADSYLNVIMADIEKLAPIVMNYCNKDRSSTTIRDKFERIKDILSDVMDEIEG